LELAQEQASEPEQALVLESEQAMAWVTV